MGASNYQGAQRCQNATWTWLEAQLDIIQALKFLTVKNS